MAKAKLTIADVIIYHESICDVYVLDCETAEYVFMEHHEFGATEEMLSILEDARAYLVVLFEIGS